MQNIDSTPLLTGRQANVMDHALAYPKKYRNGFEATNGTINDETWKELIELGFAIEVEDFAVDGKTKYSVTEAGCATLEAFHICSTFVNISTVTADDDPPGELKT
jgi:hypothetical protein